MYSWYVDGLIGRAKTWVGGSHIVEKDCEPVAVHMTVREAGRITRPTLIDIKVDGVSLFAGMNSTPAMLPFQNQKTWTTISPATLRKGSLLTMDIVQVCEETPCRDLTVELEVE